MGRRVTLCKKFKRGCRFSNLSWQCSGLIGWVLALVMGWVCSSLGLLFSSLKPSSQELGKETKRTIWGEENSALSSQLFCHSSGELGDALWFQNELI